MPLEFGSQLSAPSALEFGTQLNEALGAAITNVTGTIAPGEQIVIDTSLMSTITSATLGGEALTIDSTATDQVTCTIPTTIALLWGGTTYSLYVDDGTDNATLTNQTLNARTGWEFVNFSGTIPDPGTTDSFYELAVNDIPFTPEVGDQLQFTSATGLTVDTEFVPTVDPTALTTGTYAIYDVSGGTRLAERAYTITEPDDAPDAFSFTDQTELDASILITSNTIIPVGYDVQAPIYITDGEYSINGGAYVGVSGVIDPGDNVTIRRTTAATYPGSATVTLNIGGTGTVWTLTNRATEADTTPDAFVFTDVTDVALSTLSTSNTITVLGIDTPADITITGGEYSINAGAYTSSAGTVSADDTVTVRGTSSASFSTGVDVVLTIGGVSDTYTITTLAEDTAPDAFVFTDVTGVALSTLSVSNSVAVSGINSSAAISVTGGEYAINGGAYTASAGTVDDGDAVTVRGTSSASFSTGVDVVLTIGGLSDTYTITTLAADTTPDAFSFTDAADVALSTLSTSNAAVITGINTLSPITITGGEYSINGGAYTSSAGNVSLSDSVTVRGTSSASYSTAVDVVLTIGGVSDTYTITTLAEVTELSIVGTAKAHGASYLFSAGEIVFNVFEAQLIPDINPQKITFTIL